jgi:hypothetical protein
MQKLHVGEYILKVDDEAIDISPRLDTSLGDGVKHIVATHLPDHLQAFRERLGEKPDWLAGDLSPFQGLATDLYYMTHYQTIQDRKKTDWCLWTQLAEQNGTETTWKIHAVTLQEATEEYGG